MSVWETHLLPVLCGASLNENDGILLITSYDDMILEETTRSLMRNGSGYVEAYYPGTQSSLHFDNIHDSRTTLQLPIPPKLEQYSCVICVGLPARLQATEVHDFLHSWTRFLWTARSTQSRVVIEIFREHESEHWLDTASRYRQAARQCGFSLTEVNGVKGMHGSAFPNLRDAADRIANLRRLLPLRRAGYCHRAGHTLLHARHMRIRTAMLRCRARGLKGHALCRMWAMNRIIGRTERLFATLELI